MKPEDAGPTVGTAPSPASLVADSDDATADAGATEDAEVVTEADGVAAVFA